MSDQSNIGESIEEASAVLDQLSRYGSLISKSLCLILIGMLLVFLLQKLASKVLYPHLKDTRFIKIAFGTLYVLILVVTMLFAFERLGIDTSRIDKLAVLCVLGGAVVVFFLAPFFPRLPFKIGHMVEIDDVMGYVTQISTFHTTVRKFDGTLAYIPNQYILSNSIMNYHQLPERRVELIVSITPGSDIRKARDILLRVMGEDDRVLDHPAKPVIYATSADAIGTELTAYCWVKNSDWFAARSDLWEGVVAAVNHDATVSMARPQEDIHLIKGEEDHA